MTQSGPLYAATATAIAGGTGTWTSTANAQGSTTGTYAAWTDTTRRGASTLEGGGFGAFAAIPAGSIINSISVSVKGYVTNTTNIPTITGALGNNGVAYGTASTLTPVTTTTNVWTWDVGSAQGALPTLADLQAGGMTLDVTFTRANVTTSATANVDYFSITVNYTATASGTVAATSGASGNATILVTGAKYPVTTAFVTNEFTDPSFEYGRGGWHAYGDASADWDTTRARTGTHSLHVYGGTFPAKADIDTVLTLARNTQYTVSAWVWQAVGSAQGLMLRYQNTSGTVDGSPSTVFGNWNRISLTFTTGPVGDEASDDIYVRTASAGGEAWVDDVSLVKGTDIIPDSKDFVYQRTATANANQGVAYDGTYYYTVSSQTLYKYDQNWNVVLSRDISADYTANTTHVSAPLAKDGQLLIPIHNDPSPAIIGRWNTSDLTFISQAMVSGAPDTASAALAWDAATNQFLIPGFYTNELSLQKFDVNFNYLGNIPTTVTNPQGVLVLGNRYYLHADWSGAATISNPNGRGLISMAKDGSNPIMVVPQPIQELEGICVGQYGDLVLLDRNNNLYTLDYYRVIGSNFNGDTPVDSAGNIFYWQGTPGSSYSLRAGPAIVSVVSTVSGDAGLIAANPVAVKYPVTTAIETNEVGYPSFEYGLGGWIGYSGSSTVQDNTRAHSGTYSMHIFGGTAPALAHLPPASLNLARSTQYTFSAWVWQDPATPAGQGLQLRHQNVSGTYHDGVAATTFGSWTRITTTFITGSEFPPADEFYIRAASSGSAGWVDDIQVIKGATATPYFDGDTLYDATNVYSWQGASGSSYSDRSAPIKIPITSASSGAAVIATPTTYRAWPSTNGPSSAAISDNVGVALGVEFTVDSAATFSGWRFWQSTITNTGVSCALYQMTSSTTGTLLTSLTNQSFSTTQAWNYIPSSAGISLTPGTHYRAVLWRATPGMQYTASSGTFTSDIVNGPLRVFSVANALGGLQGSFAEPVNALQVTNAQFGNSNYWIDPEITVASASPLTASGTVNSVSALSGAVTSVLPLSGTVAGISTSAGSVVARAVSSGSISATTTTSGTPTASLVASGSVTGVSAVTGTTTALRPTSVTVAAVSGTAGSLGSTFYSTSGAVTGTSNTIGSVTSLLRSAGSINGVSSAAGSVTSILPASGTDIATSTLIGSLTARYPIVGTVAAVSASAGSVTPPNAMAGVVAGVSSVAGSIALKAVTAGVCGVLTTTIGSVAALLPDSGVVSAASNTAGSATSVLPTQGVINAVSSVTGLATSILPASSTDSVVSAVTGNPIALHPISGAVQATSSSAGSVVPSGTIAGSVIVVSNTTGSTILKTGVSGVCGVLTTTNGAVTAKLPTNGAAAVVSGVTGSVVPAGGIYGTVNAQTGVSGAVANRAVVSGVVAVVSTVAGGVTSRYRAQSVPVAAVSNTIGAVVSLLSASGSVGVNSSTTGTISVIEVVSGTTNALSSVTGRVQQTLSGVVQVISGVVGNPIIIRPTDAAGTISILSNSVGAVQSRGQVAGTVVSTSLVDGDLSSLLPSVGLIIGQSGQVGSVTANYVVHAPPLAISSVASGTIILITTASGSVYSITDVFGSPIAQHTVSGTVDAVFSLFGRINISGVGPFLNIVENGTLVTARIYVIQNGVEIPATGAIVQNGQEVTFTL